MNQVGVTLTGGVRTPSAALVGPDADRTTAGMHVDQLFLGVHGTDDHAGCTTPNLAEATANRALVGAAREVTVLADSSKWGVVGLADIVPLSAADVVITDMSPCHAVRVLQERGTTVVPVHDAQNAWSGRP